MWDMSTRLIESLTRADQAIATKMDILVDGEVVLTIDGRTAVDSTGADTSIIDGSVNVDRTTIQRSGDCAVSDLSDVLTPRDVSDLFIPLRTEFRPYRGLLFHDRTPAEVNPNDRELVPLATLVLTRVVSTWPSITLSGFDRMWLMNRYALESEMTITHGTVVTDTMVEFISSRMPPNRGDTNIPTLPYVFPTLVLDAQDNLAERLHVWAEAMGHLLYVDPMGTFVLTPEPTTDDDPVWNFETTTTGTVMPWPIEEASGEESYNVVVATGEPLDGSAPVRGIAVNSDPQSAIYADAVGRIPYMVSRPEYVTAAQAALAASTILTKLGLSDVVRFSTSVNPALAVGDCVQLTSTHPGSLSAKLLADSFAVPMRGLGPQEVTTRARIVIP